MSKKLFHAVMALCTGSMLMGCSQPQYRDKNAPPLRTVQTLDLERYQGRWFEIARFPNRFERDCVGVTADYALTETGRISVTNTCRKKTLDSRPTQANGKARLTNGGTGKLEVSFFPLIWGDYWVLYIDPEYQHAVVADPGGKFGWILSRMPQISAQDRIQLTEILATQGFDINQLEFPMQFSEANDAQP